MSKLPIVAITYFSDDWKRKVPISDLKYRGAYERFYRIAEKEGVQFVRSHLGWMTKSGFSKGWTFHNEKWQRVGPYKPSLIFDKSSAWCSAKLKNQLNARYTVVNPVMAQTIMDDKYLASLYFHPHFIKSFLIHNLAQAQAVMSKIPSTKIVLKPHNGLCGTDVRVISKRDLKKETIAPFTIIQEFIDSSRGVPGVHRGRHDFRVAMLDGKITYCYLRIPPGQSLISNIARGGSLVRVPIAKIPKSAVAITKEVQRTFSPAGFTYYSIDFIFDPHGRPHIVELNSQPGMLPQLDDRVYKTIINVVKRHLPNKH